MHHRSRSYSGFVDKSRSSGSNDNDGPHKTSCSCFQIEGILENGSKYTGNFSQIGQNDVQYQQEIIAYHKRHDTRSHPSYTGNTSQYDYGYDTGYSKPCYKTQ